MNIKSHGRNVLTFLGIKLWWKGIRKIGRVKIRTPQNMQWKVAFF